MKNATPRNSASPPSHANSFTPMNCSQLMAGSILRGGAGDNCGGSAAWAKTGGGAAPAWRTGGIVTGFGISSGAGGIIPGCMTGAGGVGAGAVTGSDLGLDSLSCLSRMISDSSSPIRRASSSRRLFPALTARTISQSHGQRNGNTKNQKDHGYPVHTFYLSTAAQPDCSRSVRLARGFWQATLRRRRIYHRKKVAHFMSGQRYRLLVCTDELKFFCQKDAFKQSMRAYDFIQKK